MPDRELSDSERDWLRVREHLRKRRYELGAGDTSMESTSASPSPTSMLPTTSTADLLARGAPLSVTPAILVGAR